MSEKSAGPLDAQPLVHPDCYDLEQMAGWLNDHATNGMHYQIAVTLKDAADSLNDLRARLSQSSARAEGWQEGVEAAAGVCSKRQQHLADFFNPDSGGHRLSRESEAAFLEAAIRAFLPTPRPATPAQPMTGRMVREPGGFAGVADWQAGPPELTEPQRVEAMLRHHANLQTELIPLWSREAKVAVDLLDAERAAHKATEGHAQILLRDIDTLAARVQRLEEAIQTALRCIEETGLIKSACDGLRAALAADQKKGS